MSLPVKLARLLLVAALLAAQQSAVAHGLWHFAGAASAPHSGTQESTLCDQHSALGTVLGVLGNAQAAAPRTPQRAAAIAAPPRISAPATLLVPCSRDPPVLL